MAVPFNIPEDQGEVEVLLVQLQTLLSRLQIAVRKNQLSQQIQQHQMQASTSTSNPNPSNSRVRHSTNSRSRSREANPSTSSVQNALPEMLSTFAWLDTTSTESNASSLTAMSIRSPRARTSSEASNSDETKISVTAIVKHGYWTKDWNKIDDSAKSEESQTLPSEGLLSKLMPASVSSCSLMTAMICFVGWHIFRGR